MLRYAHDTSASAEDVWPLIACPSRWSEWAPHVRGSWNLGSPEVREGARGAVLLAGVLPVPVRIAAVDPGRSWTWVVGAGPAAVEMEHLVRPHAHGGACVAVTLRAAGPTEAVLRRTYGPLVELLVARLARTATRQAASRPAP